MVYTPIFITSLTKVANMSMGALTVAQLNDDIVQAGEDRVILDLAAGHHLIGSVSVTYQTLRSLDYAWFNKALEYAAVYAVLSECNKNGYGNAQVGPIISASGDGMAMTSAYYNSKKVNNNALLSAEENYLYKMQQIFKYYNAKRTKALMASRYNEFYETDHSASDADRRQTEGNPI
jgi:hypothetical protein